MLRCTFSKDTTLIRIDYCASSIFIILLISATTAFAEVPVVPRGDSFTCTPTHVWDGDGPIWCREGPHLRLAGIAARELDDSCSKGHPCPTPSGIAARDALVDLLGGPTGIGRYGHILVSGPKLRCKSDGSAGGNRTSAWCKSPKLGDLNCAMVKTGAAVVWDKYWRKHNC
jgi:endonuclease YncB( thermonuclease family)